LGLDIALSTFGQSANHLPVGNFGDGKINVSDPNQSNALLGALTDSAGNPIVIEGRWRAATALLPRILTRLFHRQHRR
jgi:hypothetical protein